MQDKQHCAKLVLISAGYSVMCQTKVNDAGQVWLGNCQDRRWLTTVAGFVGIGCQRLFYLNVGWLFDWLCPFMRAI